MKRLRWITSIVLFVVSIGVAIAFSHFIVYDSPLASVMGYSQSSSSAAAEMDP